MKPDRKASIEAAIPTHPQAGPAYGTLFGSILRQGAESDRIAAVVRPAVIPAAASAVIMPAPARGPVRTLIQEETVMAPSGPRPRRLTVDGQHPVIAQDAFDRMETGSANRRGEARPLFSVWQVEAGRSYAALHERCAAEGLRCSSPKARQGGSGSEVDWMQGVIDRSRRLAVYHLAIGTGIALSPRNARAHADRGKRSVIRVRQLVDAVCIEARVLSQVLEGAGWSPRAETIKALRVVLGAALDRMYGL